MWHLPCLLRFVARSARRGIASLLKRWSNGTHYLGAYLDDFAFRFNRRQSRRRGLFFLLILKHAVVTPPPLSI